MSSIQRGIGDSSDGLKLSPKAFNSRRRNQLDANGKILRCDSCGSFRHLLASCRDSWEIMEGVKVSKDEVVPKGYSLDCITNSRVDTNNSAVFDNGQSRTECRSKRECKASIDVNNKYEEEKSSQEFAKKYNERVKPRLKFKKRSIQSFELQKKSL